jgi:hypothetical protein
VSGQSQGGGAALKAGDGILRDGDGFTQMSTVVAMNPYGPSYVMAQNQNDQILLLGGTRDTVTPTDTLEHRVQQQFRLLTVREQRYAFEDLGMKSS